ncbi:Serine threonine- kinase ssp1 [Lecanosticta acicola]|uniref:non-specific serine/threonine protein kinase n=1 Tax=Lecanosticta acicola TaxID=111012 RepID=A0AAI8YYN2_9PEZI|nr:Serine threonine- kinase ssp1 [Lecanosticta acicola]
MSTDSREDGGRALRAVVERPTSASAVEVKSVSLETPRPEMPLLSVVTPGQSQRKELSTGSDYFTQQPAGPPTSAPTDATCIHRPPPPPTHSPSAAGVSTSDATAEGQIQLAGAHSSLPITAPAVPGRPPPHTTQSSLSIESSTSTSTITLSNLPLPQRPAFPQYPQYPNQAHSALHSQQYPPYYLPQGIRRPQQPHQISTFASAIASLHSSGVRTAHNSPAVTPGNGLFSPVGPPSAPAPESSDGSGTYASPFLHFTHTHVPKETHVADVDVDPVSGRKLINHYEIIDELGRGTHGKVKLGRDLTSSKEAPTYVAIKIVERFSKRRKLGRLGTTEDKVKKEVAILKKARHPNVVALLEVIDDPSRKKVYIVLEWVERGEINWRTKGPKEIGMIESRRYEREKKELEGTSDEQRFAVDAVILTEAQKRLARQKRRQAKAYRLLKKGAIDNPEAWSIEMAGDTESEDSEGDRLSRISSLTGPPSDVGKLSVDAFDRRPSRTPSPLHPSIENAHTGSFLSLTEEPQQMSSPRDDDQTSFPRRTSSAYSSMTGLEGTMNGANDIQSQTSRVASLNSLTSSRGSIEQLEQLHRRAIEDLDSYLDAELEYVPVMTMEQIRVAFRDTLLGLQYLHYQGIVHRDIKPPNLLATIDNRVKISDFGVSYLGKPVRDGEPGEDVSEAEAQDLDDEAKELAKTVGTPAFYAPELCISESTGEDPPPVTKAIDVWALGVTLFCMLFARTPFVEDQFVVMRQIADEEIYLPRKRLQPVDTKPKSRPGSHGRAFPPLTSGRRHELDLVYEEISDELHDLLKRLLTKDPRKRITLEEVRHHPWLLADLPNKIKWLEDTDPSRQAEGKKIEVSKEDVNTAVVPLNLVERMRSGLKKVFEKTGITRTRGQSNASASKDASPVPSAGSSSTTISQDGPGKSFRGDESVFIALQLSRDGGHPLSNSVAASPELDRREKYFDDIVPKKCGSGDDLARATSRPSPPYRANTVASSAGSMRTVKQSDFRGEYLNSFAEAKDSPPPSPGLPGTPHAILSPGGSGLGGLLGGTGRLMKSVRERSVHRTTSGRGRSSDRGSVASSDPHAEASLAVSQATAAGHMHQPDSLREPSNPSARNSPSSSRPQSFSSESQHLNRVEPGLLSRIGSSNSIASIGRHVGEVFRNASRTRSASRRPVESSAEDLKRADEERVRKLVRQHQDVMESQRGSPANVFDFSVPFDGRDCPASPDDMRAKRGNSRVPSVAATSNPETPSEGISPTNQTGQLPPALVSSSSDLGSAVSISISNPSIPSVLSEASSYDPDEGIDDTYSKTMADPPSDDTLSPGEQARYTEENDDEGYTPDQETALESGQDDEYADSSDSDGGLVMSRRKSNAKLALAIGGDTHKERRGTGLSARSKKSSRSGSNNTMKKVRTRESGDGRRSLEISEEQE